MDVDRDFRGPVNHIYDLEIIGNYSINGDRKYCSDIKQLKYYKKPLNSKNVNFNLNLNENIIRHKINEDFKLNYVLTWILENFDILKVQDSKDVTQWLVLHLSKLQKVLILIILTK